MRCEDHRRALIISLGRYCETFEQSADPIIAHGRVQSLRYAFTRVFFYHLPNYLSLQPLMQTLAGLVALPEGPFKPTFPLLTLIKAFRVF